MIPTTKCLVSEKHVKASCTEEEPFFFVFPSLTDNEASFCKSPLLLLIIYQLLFQQKVLSEFQWVWKARIEISFKNVLANYKQ
jgi:hypothetical protein